jgi:cephalosporin hydroxylase
MKILIDQEAQTIETENTILPLYSPEGFRLISDLWLKVGWDQKHLYGFTWMGRPIIQIPDDMIRIQEVIYSLKPDFIIETGVAHGGSLIFMASLCKAIGTGRIIGVDIEIRPHNRKAIEDHELYEWITLFEGDSIAQNTFHQVAENIKDEDKVLVILDSCHTYEHVLAELRLYSQLVTKGSYIVVTDGLQELLGDTPRAKKEYSGCDEWINDNPKKAAEAFVREDKNFVICEPKFPFQEGNIDFRITHWPAAFLLKS